MFLMSIELAKKNFIPNYNPAPFVISHAKGSWIFDTEGKKYLDFACGIAVNNLGHCPPKVVEAAQKQAELLIHSSNMFWNEPSMSLANKLKELSFADRVFFCNSGAEANEAALKLARKYFYDQGKPRPNFLSFESGFHGRTFGALSATSKEKYRLPFEPLVPGFQYGKFNDVSSVNLITESTAAVLIEPIQGEGGIFPANLDFMKAIRDRCDQTGALLILDCIQVGMMRTGDLFGYESLNVKPDIVSLAKALANGFPIGAILTTEKLAESFQPGSHGTTFGGNAVSCAAANAVLEEMTNPDFRSEFKNRSDYLWSKLNEKLRSHPKIKELRGRGMMIGIEFKDHMEFYFQKLREENVLVTKILPQTFRVLPPLNAQFEEIDFFIENLLKALSHDADKK
ncbi:MAG: aspartate aminotransferase family protein [Bdellovibrionota bacterium]